METGTVQISQTVPFYTNVSPSEAMNGSKLQTTLPEVSPALARQQTLKETQTIKAERDAEQKSKIKAAGCRLEIGHKTKRYQTS